jgi:hypothetical protein
MITKMRTNGRMLPIPAGFNKPPMPLSAAWAKAGVANIDYSILRELPGGRAARTIATRAFFAIDIGVAAG